MGTGGLILKVRKSSKGLTVFVSRAVRTGKVQNAFKTQIGQPVGGCVAGAVHKGMGAGEIKDAVRKCAASAKGKKLSF